MKQTSREGHGKVIVHSTKIYRILYSDSNTALGVWWKIKQTFSLPLLELNNNIEAAH